MYAYGQAPTTVSPLFPGSPEGLPSTISPSAATEIDKLRSNEQVLYQLFEFIGDKLRKVPIQSYKQTSF